MGAVTRQARDSREEGGPLGRGAAPLKGTQGKTPASRGEPVVSTHFRHSFFSQEALTEKLKDNTWFCVCMYCPYSRAIRLTNFKHPDCGKPLMGSSGSDSVLSLQGPGFYPWSKN